MKKQTLFATGTTLRADGDTVTLKVKYASRSEYKEKEIVVTLA